MSETPLSDLLQSRVDAVIHQALSEQGGGIVTGFLLLTSFMDEDGEQRWSFTVAPDQRMMLTSGLLHFAQALNDSQVRAHIEDDDA